MMMPHSVSLGHNAVKYFLCVIIILVNVFVHMRDDLSHSPWAILSHSSTQCWTMTEHQFDWMQQLLWRNNIPRVELVVNVISQKNGEIHFNRLRSQMTVPLLVLSSLSEHLQSQAESAPWSYEERITWTSTAAANISPCSVKTKSD